MEGFSSEEGEKNDGGGIYNEPKRGSSFVKCEEWWLCCPDITGNGSLTDSPTPAQFSSWNFAFPTSPGQFHQNLRQGSRALRRWGGRAGLHLGIQEASATVGKGGAPSPPQMGRQKEKGLPEPCMEREHKKK